MRVSRQSIIVLLCIFCSGIATKTCAQNNDVIDGGGAVMQSPKVFLIFWLPSGFNYEAVGPAASDSRYESLIARFFTDISAGTYLTIASQYPGICSPPSIPTQQNCFGPVTLGGTFVDTHPYPNQAAGSSFAIVADCDIQGEITSIMNSNKIIPSGLNQEFFVFLGVGVTLCTSCGMCTPGGIANIACAYHSNLFADNQGTFQVPYAVMSTQISTPGCLGAPAGTVGTGDIVVDAETFAISHELLESLTDPLGDNWSFQGGAFGSDEIGDLCTFASGTVSANGHNYVVQGIWSNDDNACVLTFAPAISGTKVEFTSSTGTGSLRSDASVSALLNGNPSSPPLTLHSTGCSPLPCGSWDPGSVHVRVFSWTSQPGPVLTDALISLTSGAAPSDQWSLNSLDLKVRNPNGTLVCEQSGSGSPLATITDGSPFAFVTPNCDFFNPHPLGPRGNSSNGVVADVFWKTRSLGLSHEFLQPNLSWVGPENLLGGPLGSDPYPVATVATVNGAADVLWKGTDGDLRHTWYTPPLVGSGEGTWDGPDHLGVSQVASEPHAVANPYGGVDVFWRATDNTLWHKWINTNWYASLQPSEEFLSGPVGSDPHPVVSIGSVEDVFWKGTDGDLWHMRYTPPVPPPLSIIVGNGAWVGPESLHAGQLGSEPYPLVSGGAMYVFWKGTDGDLWYEVLTQNGWSGPGSLHAGQLGSDPHPIDVGNGGLAVFWKGTDGDLWYEVFTQNAGWAGPGSLHVGKLGSDPYPVGLGNGGFEVFWRGIDNNIWHMRNDGSLSLGPQILVQEN